VSPDLTISDEDVARLRHLASLNWSASSLASKFNVSERHVRRLIRGDRRPTIASVADIAQALPPDARAAVEHFLQGLELDAGDEVLAAAARSVAVKLDAVAASETAAAAQAMPRLADALLDVLDRLQERRREPDALDALRERRRVRLQGPTTNGWAS